ncbi:3-isopropylmalate dehydratase small subunit [Pelovirga terrestris]|uniref:3-isopropylmalate dehydratase small subunit n=1 Tax=Pelovirga terrestris TaxID=2771352 RepID=A0A8J6QMG9_9BACT|nr:3-isopropylmalate dehydratase small subunit [Pelovirga terrestris]MBD1401344.1 3-isopropylmalate dehydratase small subunit [Pelovirga terrestris]
MKPFQTLTGMVAPLDRSNIDTDAIIPKQFLKSIKRTGFGPFLFDEWRYLDHGEPDMDCSKRPANPDFILNQPRYTAARILLTRANFGCGSSREHAPWALLDYGFEVIIAPSFADIFYNNCFKNGILPIVLPSEKVDLLFHEVETTPGYQLTINLEQQHITTPTETTYSFDIDPFRKHCLLGGLDDIALTLEKLAAIKAFEEQHRQQSPWLFSSHPEA